MLEEKTEDKCPICKGDGYTVEKDSHPDYGDEYIDCPRCRG